MGKGLGGKYARFYGLLRMVGPVQCDEAWMKGFCRASCGTCIVAVPVPAPDCSDVPPPSTEQYTCHQQANVFQKVRAPVASLQQLLAV